MGNKEQGRARTGGDVEEERVGGRGNILSEEGEPQNHVQELTAHHRGVRRKHDEPDAEKGTVEGECRQYKDAFVGVAEELCGRTSGKGGTPISRNQGCWKEEVAKAVGENREAWNMIEGIRDRGEEPPTGLRHLCGWKKKAIRRAVDIARISMEEELFRKLDEYGGKKMIFKMARDII